MHHFSPSLSAEVCVLCHSVYRRAETCLGVMLAKTHGSRQMPSREPGGGEGGSHRSPASPYASLEDVL